MDSCVLYVALKSIIYDFHLWVQSGCRNSSHLKAIVKARLGSGSQTLPVIQVARMYSLLAVRETGKCGAEDSPMWPTILVTKILLQWALEQHGFELHMSTCTRMFSSVVLAFNRICGWLDSQMSRHQRSRICGGTTYIERPAISY